ncbi:PfkB family carbohydrate kinase [Bogoriella caseilytica]|uniref:Mannose-6-phosphate isomerase class I n=1 Tax=Bogoriella caseilytica TaxID=56055 RepID=A0A3N2BDW0_9MICO|nr:PfkB family carbohydrate kinase [Bogoriella caseilytica]ROR73440.1 mannose-6-phosphate isomerase class I [Bogoriella caseilytica]
MRRVAVAGHVCLDLVPRQLPHGGLTPGSLVEVGHLDISLGGSVANTARTLQQLGHPVRACATIGDDDLADVLRKRLSGPLVQADLTQVPATTSYSLVVEPGGQDRAFWHHVGANADFDPGVLDLGDAEILHLGYPSLLPGLLVDEGEPLLALLRRARAQGVTTSVDLAVVSAADLVSGPDWERLLPALAAQCDVLSPSLADLQSILPAGAHSAASCADQLVRWGAGVVVVSDGEAGLALRAGTAGRLREGGAALAPLSASWAGAAIDQTAVTVDHVVTTNGAGDAVSAAVLYALSVGLSPVQAGALMAAVAAAVVSGGTPDARAIARLGLLSAGSGPIPIGANQPSARFYRGGSQIAGFRGQQHVDDHTPEDWVASTVEVRGQEPVGLTRLPDGRLLREAIAEDPERWLGREHAARFGADTKLLVKLLDAGQRLPVHAHPGGEFAQHALGVSHGKAEAWYILTPGTVYLGLRESIGREAMADLVARQETETMLELLHEIQVEAGDCVYVPPGTLHAIGEGILLVEVQEPEDLSILLEWRGFDLDGAAEGHLGLGFDRALGAVDLSAMSDERVSALVARAPATGPWLPEEAESFFRLEVHQVAGTVPLDDGYAVMVGLEGEVQLGASGCLPTALAAGRVALVPAAARGRWLAGTGRVIVLRPPAS